MIAADTFTNNVGDGTSGDPEAAVSLEAQTAGRQFNVAVTNNVMANNGKGLSVYNATGVAFTGNLVTGSTDAASAAVRIEGNVAGMTIANNVVLGGKGAAVRITNRFVGPSSAIAVNYNTFAGNAGGGLVVDAGGYTGCVDDRFNHWGSSGPGVVLGATTGPYLAFAAPLSKTLAADNGVGVTLAADLTIAAYALSLRDLALLAALVPLA